MQDRTPKNPAYRGTDRSGRVPCCAVSLDDLRRLYGALQAKNNELLAEIMEGYQEDPENPREVFEENVRNNLRVSVVVTGANGEQVVTHDISGLDEANLPSIVATIVIDTAWVARIVLQGQEPLNRGHVLLDFRRPPLIDLSNASGDPTPNGSNYRVIAANETWGAAVHEVVKVQFAGRTLARAWLHGRHTYDAILLLVGFPSVLWGTWRLSGLVRGFAGTESPGLAIVATVYVFLVLLYVFRGLFGVARWLWPYVELRREGQGGAAGFWRFALGTVILSILSALIYDAAKVVLLR